MSAPDWETVAYHALDVARECNETSEEWKRLTSRTNTVILPLGIGCGFILGLFLGAFL